MELSVRLLAAFGLATLVSWRLVPVGIRIAVRLDFVDRPAGWKTHSRATPYLGGVPVIIAASLAMLLFTPDLGRVAPIATGGILLGVLGTLDDRYGLRARHRLLVQAAVGVLVWSLGVHWQFDVPAVLGLVLTVGWLLAVVNAVNFADLMDGLAAALMAVAAAACLALGVLHDDLAIAATGAALLGALVGFLPFNFASPARVFLGNGGSAGLGFIAAAGLMAIQPSGPAGAELVGADIAVMGLVLFDIAYRVCFRVKRGIPVLTPGHDSIASLLRARLPSDRAVALTAAAAQTALAALALLALELGPLAVALTVLLWLAASLALVASLDSIADDIARA